MANELLFQGGVLPTDPTRPMPGTDEPTLADHDAPRDDPWARSVAVSRSAGRLEGSDGG